MCCGSQQDLYSATRFGALAVLSTKGFSRLSGKVVFFNQADVSSAMATHVKLIMDDATRLPLDLSLTIL